MSRRVKMDHIRKVIQMSEQSSLSLRKLSEICNCSRAAVTSIINVLKLNSLTYKQSLTMTDKQLEDLFYPDRIIKAAKKPELDYEYLANELKKPDVTRMLLWRENIDKYPNGYKRSQFFELLNKYLETKKVTMHVHRKPGEKMYVDWAGDPMFIYDKDTGEQKKVSLFVTCIGCSSYPYVEAFLTKEKVNFIQAHVNAFNYYGALPLILVPDNDKSAVITANKYEPVINETYKRLADYYGIGIIPARRKTPKDKASVEKTVLDIAEREVIAALRNEKFFSLFELNIRIKQRLKEVSERPFQKKPGSRFSVFKEFDLPNMRPLPLEPFEYAEYVSATVNIDYHIEVEKNFYSVPYIYVKKVVNVEISIKIIQIFYNNERIAVHPRIRSGQYHYQTDSSHMPEEHKLYNQFSRDYFINWAKKISEEAQEIMISVFERRFIEEQGFRNGLGIQRLYKEYGDEKFKSACIMIIQKNIGKSYINLKKVLESIPILPKGEKSIEHNNIRGKAYYSWLKHNQSKN